MPVQLRQVCHAAHLTAPLQTSRHCSDQACTTLAPSIKTGRLLPLLSALSVVCTAFPPPSCNAEAPSHEVSVQRHFYLRTSCKVAATTSSSQSRLPQLPGGCCQRPQLQVRPKPGWNTRMHPAARLPAR